jgi:hypothetical protein
MEGIGQSCYQPLPWNRGPARLSARLLPEIEVDIAKSRIVLIDANFDLSCGLLVKTSHKSQCLSCLVKIDITANKA